MQRFDSRAGMRLAAALAGALIISFGLNGPVLAVGTSDGGSGNTPSSTEAPAVPPLSAAQRQIDGGHYDKAIEILKQILKAKPNYADALNLMGFSLRKTGQMSRALQFYNKALAANPNHLGAHEYLGELYLETGKPGKAQEQLDILKGLCGTSCEEYLDLKKAIGS